MQVHVAVRYASADGRTYAFDYQCHTPDHRHARIETDRLLSELKKDGVALETVIVRRLAPASNCWVRVDAGTCFDVEISPAGNIVLELTLTPVPSKPSPAAPGDPIVAALLRRIEDLTARVQLLEAQQQQQPASFRLGGPPRVPAIAELSDSSDETDLPTPTPLPAAPEPMSRRASDRLDLAFLWASPLVYLDEGGKKPQLRAFDHTLNLETEEFTELLGLLKKQNRELSIRLHTLTHRNLSEVIVRKPRVIHVSCHGGYVKNTFVLAFESEGGVADMVRASRLADLLGADGTGLVAGVDVVFVSACHSFEAGKESARVLARGCRFSCSQASDLLSQVFSQAGVPNVVAVHSSTKVLDKACQEFSRFFYMGLCEGYSVTAAFHFAQQAVRTSVTSLPIGNTSLVSCCCSHSHKANCPWVASVLKTKGERVAHQVHTPDVQQCRCPHMHTGHHSPGCTWLEEFLTNLSVRRRDLYDGRSIMVANLPSGVDAAMLNNIFSAIDRHHTQMGAAGARRDAVGMGLVPSGRPDLAFPSSSAASASASALLPRCVEIVRMKQGAAADGGEGDGGLALARFASPEDAQQALFRLTRSQLDNSKNFDLLPVSLAAVDTAGAGAGAGAGADASRPRYFLHVHNSKSEGPLLGPGGKKAPMLRLSVSPLRVCCCSPELPHDESMKFILMSNPQRARHASDEPWAGLPRGDLRLDGQSATRPPVSFVPSPFLGRNEALYRAVTLLDRARLVSIHGTGGVGKTTFGKALARYLWDRHRFPDGIVFVDMQAEFSRNSPQTVEDVVSSIGQSMAEPLEVHSPAELCRVLEVWRGCIVLNGLDTLLSHAPDECVHLLLSLLDATKDLKLVVTSRAALPSTRAEHLKLEPLDAMASAHLLARLAGPHLPRDLATDLRRLAAHPLIALLGGHPESVRSVAPLLKTQSLDQIAADLARQKEKSDAVAEEAETGQRDGEGAAAAAPSTASSSSTARPGPATPQKKGGSASAEPQEAKAPVDTSVSSSLHLSVAFLQSKYPGAYRLLCLLSLFPAGLLADDLDDLWSKPHRSHFDLDDAPRRRASECHCDWMPHMHVLLDGDKAKSWLVREAQLIGRRHFTMTQGAQAFVFRNCVTDDDRREFYPRAVRSFASLAADILAMLQNREADGTEDVATPPPPPLPRKPSSGTSSQQPQPQQQQQPSLSSSSGPAVPIDPLASSPATLPASSAPVSSGGGKEPPEQAAAEGGERGVSAEAPALFKALEGNLWHLLDPSIRQYLLARLEPPLLPARDTSDPSPHGRHREREGATASVPLPPVETLRVPSLQAAGGTAASQLFMGSWSASAGVTPPGSVGKQPQQQVRVGVVAGSVPAGVSVTATVRDADGKALFQGALGDGGVALSAGDDRDWEEDVVRFPLPPVGSLAMSLAEILKAQGRLAQAARACHAGLACLELPDEQSMGLIVTGEYRLRALYAEAVLHGLHAQILSQMAEREGALASYERAADAIARAKRASARFFAERGQGQGRELAGQEHGRLLSREEAGILLGRGLAKEKLRRYRSAIEDFGKALLGFAASGDVIGQARTFKTQGVLRWLLGSGRYDSRDADDADADASPGQLAVELERERARKPEAAGKARDPEGKRLLTAALADLQRALALYRRVKQDKDVRKQRTALVGEASTLKCISRVLSGLGLNKLRRGLDCAKLAHSIYRDMGDTLREAGASRLIADLQEMIAKEADLVRNLILFFSASPLVDTTSGTPRALPAHSHEPEWQRLREAAYGAQRLLQLRHAIAQRPSLARAAISGCQVLHISAGVSRGALLLEAGSAGALDPVSSGDLAPLFLRSYTVGVELVFLNAPLVGDETEGPWPVRPFSLEPAHQQHLLRGDSLVAPATATVAPAGAATAAGADAIPSAHPGSERTDSTESMSGLDLPSSRPMPPHASAVPHPDTAGSSQLQVAHAFLEAGVQSVVCAVARHASQSSSGNDSSSALTPLVTEQTSSVFVGEFYRCLLAGSSIRDAFLAARQRLLPFTDCDYLLLPVGSAAHDRVLFPVLPPSLPHPASDSSEEATSPLPLPQSQSQPQQPPELVALSQLRPLQLSAAAEIPSGGVAHAIPGGGASSLVEDATPRLCPTNVRLEGMSAPLIGRNVEIHTLIALLERHKVINLYGPQGIGKSTLAAAAGLFLRDRHAFRDGLFLVNLENAKSAADIRSAVSDVMNIRPKPQNALQLFATLDRKELLLVLDHNRAAPSHTSITWFVNSLLAVSSIRVLIVTSDPLDGLMHEITPRNGPPLPHASIPGGMSLQPQPSPSPSPAPSPALRPAGSGGLGLGGAVRVSVAAGQSPGDLRLDPAQEAPFGPGSGSGAGSGVESKGSSLGLGGGSGSGRIRVVRQEQGASGLPPSCLEIGPLAPLDAARLFLTACKRRLRMEELQLRSRSGGNLRRRQAAPTSSAALYPGDDEPDDTVLLNALASHPLMEMLAGHPGSICGAARRLEDSPLPSLHRALLAEASRALPSRASSPSAPRVRLASALDLTPAPGLEGEDGDGGDEEEDDDHAEDEGDDEEGEEEEGEDEGDSTAGPSGPGGHSLPDEVPYMSPLLGPGSSVDRAPPDFVLQSKEHRGEEYLRRRRRAEQAKAQLLPSPRHGATKLWKKVARTRLQQAVQEAAGAAPAGEAASIVAEAVGETVPLSSDGPEEAPAAAASASAPVADLPLRSPSDYPYSNIQLRPELSPAPPRGRRLAASASYDSVGGATAGEGDEEEEIAADAERLGVAARTASELLEGLVQQEKELNRQLSEIRFHDWQQERQDRRAAAAAAAGKGASSRKRREAEEKESRKERARRHAAAQRQQQVRQLEKRLRKVTAKIDEVQSLLTRRARSLRKRSFRGSGMRLHQEESGELREAVEAGARGQAHDLSVDTEADTEELEGEDEHEHEQEQGDAEEEGAGAEEEEPVFHLTDSSPPGGPPSRPAPPALPHPPAQQAHGRSGKARPSSRSRTRLSLSLFNSRFEPSASRSSASRSYASLFHPASPTPLASSSSSSPSAAAAVAFPVSRPVAIPPVPATSPASAPAWPRKQ